MKKIALVLILVLSICVGICAGYRELNPESEAELPVMHQYKTNFHTHTIRSDGKFTPAEMVAKYEALGYDVLAIADHFVTTWPWNEEGIPESTTLAPIKACEAEALVAHIGLLFDTEVRSITPDAILELNRENGGLAILHHPGRYDYIEAEERAALFTRNPNLFAMEIVNRRNRYPNDRVIYDEVLTILMPERMVYCVASDDSHKEGDIGWSYTMIIAPDTSEASLRNALETGSFYAVSRGVVATPVGDAPTITSVGVENGVATISGENYDSVRWISCGEVVGTEESLNLDGLQKYVRAELWGEGGCAYSQPIALR